MALDRALKLATTAGIDRQLADWRRERETIFESLLREGFDAGVGAFVQAYGSTALDASILR
ncbi:MAG: hypothetical protein ACRERE_01525, partial [Candidatus Entotheonellia bacterium]